MTNRQSKSNPMPPKVAFAVLGKLLAGLASLAVLVYLIITADDAVQRAAIVAWAWIAKSFLDSFVSDVLRIGRAEQARALKEADNTGVWKAHEAGTFTVRYDPAADAFWIQGWVSSFQELTEETEVASTTALRTTIEEAEREGMVPEDDPATRAIRARLMVRDWDAS